MPPAHTLPERVNVEIRRPVCQKCGAYMMLARVSPARIGFEFRTFDCPKCEHVRDVMVATPAFGSPFTPTA